MVGLNPQSIEICRIIKPGLFTTVQDLGRRGFYSQGIPDGGAFDSLSFRMGNLLLRNSPQAAGPGNSPGRAVFGVSSRHPDCDIQAETYDRENGW